MLLTIESQYSTADCFVRACRFAFNESRDRYVTSNQPCPEEWVIVAAYNYYKGKKLPLSFIRSPIGLLDKFSLVDKQKTPSFVKVVANEPNGNKVLVV